MEINEAGGIKNQLIKDNKNCVENEFSFYVDLYAKNYKEKRF